MSALHPKADMCSATRHVRFVPEADIAVLKEGRAVVCWEDVTQVDAIQQSGTGDVRKKQNLAAYDKSFE
jgi:hypothetical protein